MLESNRYGDQLKELRPSADRNFTILTSDTRTRQWRVFDPLTVIQSSGDSEAVLEFETHPIEYITQFLSKPKITLSYTVKILTRNAHKYDIWRPVSV